MAFLDTTWPDGDGALDGPARPETQRVAATNDSLVDPLGRRINYLRVSITDRCNFRCYYCMAGQPAFVPKNELLSLEEIERACAVFVHLGISKVRVTGGEPLLRRGVVGLFRALGQLLASREGSELTLTTNGGLLATHARDLADCGVRRVNVSLDSRDPEKFRSITGGDLQRVLDGLDASRAAGLQVKLNAVALRGVNDDELPDMVGWCGAQGYDLTLIELMPTTGAEGFDSRTRFLSMTSVRAFLARRWTLTDIPDRTGGPARYVRVEETGGRLGFISALSDNFCSGCNRIRMTATGRLFSCLGHSDTVDLRAPLRHGASEQKLKSAIRAAIARKPERHHFAGDGAGSRVCGGSMNVTGG